MPHLKYVMRGIKRVQAEGGSKAKECLPITPHILRQLHEVWAPKRKEWDTKLIWAASTLCFFGFLRVGEMTTPSTSHFDPEAHLCIADIAVDNLQSPSIMHVTIKQSKTDPFCKGVCSGRWSDWNTPLLSGSD